MKRISLFLMAALCAMPGAARAQDAATEERLNQLNAKIQVLIEGQDLQRKRIETLEKELSALQQQSQTGASYASSEDVKQLTAKVQEVDQKRQQDNEHIVKEIEKLAKTLGAAAPRKPVATSVPTTQPSGDVFEYVVAKDDTLSVIVAAYKEKNIKVTVEQILQANPGLDPKKLRIGQKIFIPAPTKAAE